MASEKVNVQAAGDSKHAETTYSKYQLMASGKFAKRKDLLNALLEDDKQYTVAKVEEIINNFMKGRVN